MTEMQKTLISYLQTNISLNHLNTIDPISMSHLYVNAAALFSIMELIKEQVWLSKREDKKTNSDKLYTELINDLFTQELSPFAYLKETISQAGSGQIKPISDLAKTIENTVIKKMIHRPKDDQKQFLN